MDMTQTTFVPCCQTRHPTKTPVTHTVTPGCQLFRSSVRSSSYLEGSTADSVWAGIPRKRRAQVCLASFPSQPLPPGALLEPAVVALGQLPVQDDCVGTDHDRMYNDAGRIR